MEDTRYITSLKERRLFGSSCDAISTAFLHWEEITCPLCRIPPQPFAKDYQGFQLSRCPDCHLEFLNPRPTVEDLVDHVYNQTYFPESGALTALSSGQSYQFARQLRTASRWVRPGGKTVLDVGCGDGAFLRYAKESGWAAAGCDIVLTRSARKAGCSVWEGQLAELDFRDLRFDVVRFNHVLEHSQNPLAELQRSRELLQPNGILYISVPNLAGASARIKNLQSLLHLKQHRWRHYAALHHLWFFTPKTLRALLERAGLRPLFWETPLFKKDGNTSFLEMPYRYFLEGAKASSILDYYCTPAEQ